MVAAEVAFWVSVVSQHKASLVHNRQLRFSSLRPCSTDSAHLEKTVHMLKRLWGLFVSTLWITLGSTVRTSPSALPGILAEFDVHRGDWGIGRRKKMVGVVVMRVDL